MSDFQEQAKNWLRNVVKQNPDKIKAGVEKAGDLIDKQTGGKYAEKVDSVQQKVGGFVDKRSGDDSTPPAPGTAKDTSTAATEAATTTEEAAGAASEPAGPSTSTASGTAADSSAGAESRPGTPAESADERRSESQTGPSGGQI
jgi:hypothetical protein